MMMIKSFLIALLSVSVIGRVQSFVTPSPAVQSAPATSGTVTIVFMSDVPKDKVDEQDKAKRKRQLEVEEPWMERNRRLVTKNWRDDWLPEPPEDQLTLAGDVASLFLYAFMDHFLNDVYLASILASSTSAADAAHTLDPSGTDIVLSSTPVWVDPTALGPHVSDHLLLIDLQEKVMPHFTPVLDSAGMASVAMASCWLAAGLLHKAFHYQNTIDCSTERAVAVTGQTWVTASILMIIMATTSCHLSGVYDVQALSTGVLMMEGRILTPIEEWFSVLSRADADYIFGSLGVLLTWRFLISFLLGGWNKK